jgi:uncharacterized protein
MKADARFLEGLRLFNEKEYFECHEVIEELWLETPSEDPYRDLYKGVIQAAACIYQFDRGILSGAEGLYRTSMGYLEKYRPKALGLDVDGLLEGMRSFYKDPAGARPGVSYEPSPSEGKGCGGAG